MKCPNCDQAIEPNMPFCGGCGEPVQLEPIKVFAKGDKLADGWKPLLWPILSFVASPVLMAVGFHFLDWMLRRGKGDGMGGGTGRVDFPEVLIGAVVLSLASLWAFRKGFARKYRHENSTGFIVFQFLYVLLMLGINFVVGIAAIFRFDF